MPIYEYKGVHYDIDTTDPVLAKNKILASLPPPKTATDYAKDFGKSAASLGDMILGAPSALAGQATYAGARALQKSPEEATQLQNKVMSGQVPFIPSANPIGNQLGITNDPAYQNEASRRMMGYVGQGVTSVAPSVSNMTGIPTSDVENMMNTGLMAAGPVAAKAAPYIAKAAPLANPMNYYRGAKGVAHGVMNPEPGMPGSAYVPLKDYYYPDWAVQQFNAGKIGLNELEQSKQGSSQLFNTPQTQQALNSAETNMAGERMIPVQGRVPQAIGERIGREYVANPLTAAADIGLSIFSGAPLPISAAQKAAQAYRTGQLSKAANFDPQFASNLAKAQQEAAFNASRPPAPPAGPVAPAATPAELSQQVAASKIAESGPVAPVETAPTVPLEQQIMSQGGQGADILAQIRARAEQAKQGVTTSPVAPVEATPPAPVPSVTESLPSSRWTPAEQEQIARLTAAENTAPPAPAPVVETPAPPAPAKAPSTLDSLRTRLQQNEQQVEQLRQPMLGRNPAEMAPAEVEAYRKQMDQLGREHVELTKQQIELEKAQAKEQKAMLKDSQKSINEDIIRDFATNGTTDKLDMIRQTIPLDVSKDVYNGSNATRGAANKLLKNGVDSIPVLDGMTESEIVHAIANKLPGSKKKGPGNVSQMLTDDQARTFNGIKSAGESEFEQKIASIPQVHRDVIEQGLRKLNNPNDPLIKHHLDILEKYRIK